MSTTEPATQPPQAVENLDLTDIEVEILEELFENLRRANRELSIAYTMAFAARELKGKKVIDTNLKQQVLHYIDRAGTET